MPSSPAHPVRNLLITGGAGNVGRRLRAELAGGYEKIRILDLVVPLDLRAGEEAFAGDIADIAIVERAMTGMDGVIHLAALNGEAPIENIMRVNMLGSWNIFEAARRGGVKRVVFGSSNHAVGFYPRTHIIDETCAPRPDTRYGLSKCFGESCGALYADKHAVKSLSIRIGNCAPRPAHLRALSNWISARDLAQLCRIGLDHPGIHSQIVYGVSNNAASWYDNREAFRLGYAPQDRAEDFAAQAMHGEKNLPPADPVAAYYQGAQFCSREYDGDGVPGGA